MDDEVRARNQVGQGADGLRVTDVAGERAVVAGERRGVDLPSVVTEQGGDGFAEVTVAAEEEVQAGRDRVAGDRDARVIAWAGDRGKRFRGPAEGGRDGREDGGTLRRDAQRGGAFAVCG